MNATISIYRMAHEENHFRGAYGLPVAFVATQPYAIRHDWLPTMQHPIMADELEGDELATNAFYDRYDDLLHGCHRPELILGWFGPYLDGLAVEGYRIFHYEVPLTEVILGRLQCVFSRESQPVEVICPFAFGSEHMDAWFLFAEQNPDVCRRAMAPMP